MSTTVRPGGDQLADALRRWTGKDDHKRAAEELLIAHGFWLRRSNFLDAALRYDSDGDAAMILWTHARKFIDTEPRLHRRTGGAGSGDRLSRRTGSTSPRWAAPTGTWSAPRSTQPLATLQLLLIDYRRFSSSLIRSRSSCSSARSTCISSAASMTTIGSISAPRKTWTR